MIDLATRMEAKFDNILAAHEALRTTNRELSAENKQLKKEARLLRMRIRGTAAAPGIFARERADSNKHRTKGTQ